MILALLLLAQEPAVDARARAWLAWFDGATLADGRSGQGTRTDAGELGLDGTEPAGAAELTLRWPDLGRFTLEYARLAFEGSETLAGEVVFDDDLFPAGTRVDASLALDLWSFDYGFVLWTTGAFRLEGEAGMRYVSGRMELEGGGAASKAKLNRPLLMPGLKAEARLAPWLTADLDLHAIAFSAANVALRWLELDAAATVRPGGGFRAGLGYRLYRVDVKATEDSTNFDVDGVLHGPYLELGWDF
ncbi:MAG TPA: hypothetical protein VF950_24770 [Planctomycetota bacterium]